jgi:hypothetical protein
MACVRVFTHGCLFSKTTAGHNEKQKKLFVHIDIVISALEYDAQATTVVVRTCMAVTLVVLTTVYAKKGDNVHVTDRKRKRRQAAGRSARAAGGLPALCARTEANK